MKFADLGLAEALQRAVQAENYHTPTPIQAEAIPHILRGRDVLGCAQTGTGKTAAFTLPVLHRLLPDDHKPHLNAREGATLHSETHGHRPPRGAKRPIHLMPRPNRAIRGLILAPTRELAAQISESLDTYGRFTGLKQTVVYGGVGQGPQVYGLRQGVDMVVATPGRLLDLMQQGHCDLRNTEILILDEADQMLDMGFLPALKRIVATVPRQRQTLLFSATMAPEIRELAEQWLTTPVEVHVAPVATPATAVRQTVCHVEGHDKTRLLTHVLRHTATARTLVFTRTKHGADKVVKQLERNGIRAAAIHGNKSQNVRQRVLSQFRSEQPPVLIATDVAARGLDINAVSHVINFDMPEVPELYVHRIGRTGRAGATGEAISFCSPQERGMLRQIERLIKRNIDVQRISVPKEAPPAPGAHTPTAEAPATRPPLPTSNHERPRFSAEGGSHRSEAAGRGPGPGRSNGPRPAGPPPFKRKARPGRRERMANRAR